MTTRETQTKYYEWGVRAPDGHISKFNSFIDAKIAKQENIKLAESMKRNKDFRIVRRAMRVKTVNTYTVLGDWTELY